MIGNVRIDYYVTVAGKPFKTRTGDVIHFGIEGDVLSVVVPKFPEAEARVVFDLQTTSVADLQDQADERAAEAIGGMQRGPSNEELAT